MTITRYKGAEGNVWGHIGIGVNIADPLDTVGAYPEKDSAASLYSLVPGEIKPDRTQKNAGDILETITLPTSPEQDALMQAFIDRSMGQRKYNFPFKNCADFVRETLKAGGIDVPNYSPQTPKSLMNFLSPSPPIPGLESMQGLTFAP